MDEMYRIAESSLPYFADPVGMAVRYTIPLLDELEPVALELEGIEEVIRNNLDRDKATAALAAVRRFLSWRHDHLEELIAEIHAIERE